MNSIMRCSSSLLCLQMLASRANDFFCISLYERLEKANFEVGLSRMFIKCEVDLIKVTLTSYTHCFLVVAISRFSYGLPIFYKGK